MPKQKVATQISPRALAARLNGAKGGKARAANPNNTKKKIKEWGAKGGKATLALYGSDYYTEVAKQSATVGRYRTPRTA